MITNISENDYHEQGDGENVLNLHHALIEWVHFDTPLPRIPER